MALKVLTRARQKRKRLKKWVTNETVERKGIKAAEADQIGDWGAGKSQEKERDTE